MKFSLEFAVLVLTLSATSAAAQEPVDTVAETSWGDVQKIIEKSGVETAIDSIARKSTPELEDALEQLTGTLNVLARRIANDPELRTSALRAAEGLIKLTETVVSEQSEVLLEVLRTAGEEISAASPGARSETSVPERNTPRDRS